MSEHDDVQAVQELNEAYRLIAEQLGRVIVGQRQVIEELLVEGQEVLVQVAKSPIGTKGARISSHVSIPGRFLVLMPSSSHIGISRRIEDEAERQRLKQLVHELRKDDFGYIVRTAAEGESEERITYEMGFLTNLWENIQRKYEAAPAPSLIYQDLSISLRAVRDLLIHEAEKLVIDSKPTYESVLAFLDSATAAAPP